MVHWISQTYSFDRGKAQTEKVQHKLNEHVTLCVLVLFLLAPRLLTTFLISNFYITPKSETLCQLYMCTTTCPFCPNLVTTQRLCVFLSCAPQSSQYAALGFSLQLLQPWVGVPSFPRVQFSWQQKSRRRSKCARGPADCRGLSRRGERTGRDEAISRQLLCRNSPQVQRGLSVKDVERALKCSGIQSTTRADEINTHWPEWREGFSSLFTNVNDKPVIKPVKKPKLKFIQWQR